MLIEQHCPRSATLEPQAQVSGRIMVNVHPDDTEDDPRRVTPFNLFYTRWVFNNHRQTPAVTMIVSTAHGRGIAKMNCTVSFMYRGLTLAVPIRHRAVHDRCPKHARCLSLYSLVSLCNLFSYFLDHRCLNFEFLSGDGICFQD